MSWLIVLVARLISELMRRKPFSKAVASLEKAMTTVSTWRRAVETLRASSTFAKFARTLNVGNNVRLRHPPSNDHVQKRIRVIMRASRRSLKANCTTVEQVHAPTHIKSIIVNSSPHRGQAQTLTSMTPPLATTARKRAHTRTRAGKEASPNNRRLKENRPILRPMPKGGIVEDLTEKPMASALVVRGSDRCACRLRGFPEYWFIRRNKHLVLALTYCKKWYS